MKNLLKDDSAREMTIDLAACYLLSTAPPQSQRFKSLSRRETAIICLGGSHKYWMCFQYPSSLGNTMGEYARFSLYGQVSYFRPELKQLKMQIKQFQNKTGKM